MQYRPLGSTGMSVSTISFGAWAIGGSWGPVDDRASIAALHAALDAGVNFIDTADVYGDGRSERLVAQVRRDRRDPVFVATKAGRRLTAQTPDGYTRENLEAWIDRSLANLEVETIDLLQLHCPHSSRLRSTRGLRRSRRPHGRRQAPPLRRQRRNRRRSAEGDGVSERQDRPDHLQPVPAQARRAAVRRSRGSPHRHHRARAARQWPADREAAAGFVVRCR